MSYLLKDRDGNGGLLFGGDLVLGSDSVSVEDLQAYMNSLYSLKERLDEFDSIALSHSVRLEKTNDVIVSAREKLNAYIFYRESRLEELRNIIQNGAKTKEQMFDAMYGSRRLTGWAKDASWNNLEQQLTYLNS